MKCPQCNEECICDEVDIGVGTLRGNYRCDCCGWSEENIEDVFQPESGEEKKQEIFVIFDGYYNPPIPPEKVKEYCFMPSGDIVVKTEGGESYWFDKNGKHPKSHLEPIPKGGEKCSA